MASSRVTLTLDDAVAAQARRLGIDVSAAAREGVAEAVRTELARLDRTAYERQPERADSAWNNAEAWGGV